MSKRLESASTAALDRASRAGTTATAAGAFASPTVDIQKGMSLPLEGGVARAVKLRYIAPDPDQPRKTFDEKTLRELADSIEVHGVIHPITLRSAGEGRGYFIVTGERRFRACELLGWDSVPAIIRDQDFDLSMTLPQQLVENLQREHLAPVEAARAIKHFMDEQGLTQREAAKRLGKPKTYVAELLGILKLPDRLLDEASSAGLGKHALIEVSREKDPRAQERALKRSLESDKPFKVAKHSRTKRAGDAPETAKPFRARFEVEGQPLVGILTAPGRQRVRKEEQVAFLRSWIRDLQGS